MLKPLGYNLTTSRTFLAVMIGYIANLVLPRMGEVSRCAALKRLDDVTIATSFGSVVTERLIDFACLISLILIALMVDYNVINDAMVSIFSGGKNVTSPNIILYGILGILVLTALLILMWRFLKKNLLRNPMFQKLRKFLLELRDGLNSLKGIENKTAFWVSTLFLWILYYFMSYVVIFAIPQTEHLSLAVGLSLLVMGGLGMSAPVQGGFGTYHFLVASVLIVYGLSEDDGLFFATLLHTSQTIAVIVVGSLSIFVTMILTRRKKTSIDPTTTEFSAENQ
jgi:glycosyltransferase 2 family protein